MRRYLKPLLLVLAILAIVVLGQKVVHKLMGLDEEPVVSHSIPSVPPPPPPRLIEVDGYTAYVPPGSARLPDVPKNLVDAVAEGKELLANKRLNQAQCVPSHPLQIGWKRCIGDYLVAAVNETGKLQIVDVYGGESTSPSGFSVTCERDGACDGGVNPPFIISSPPGWTAVAVRTAVHGDGPDGVDGAVYVPYSTRLDTPAFREAGLVYLRDAVLAAYYEMRAKDVRSQFIKGRLVTDFGTPDHIITLILTEQMWSDTWFAKGADLERLQMLDRALVTLGLNRWKSFSYTKSWADARGIGQIVGTPYKAIRAQYPRADLPQDDVWGRVDHHNAIKTMIAHTDAEWWTFREESQREFYLTNTWQRQLVFAAGYNANIATVKRAIKACGDSWRDESCTTLPTETRLYLVKYEWIHGVLFDPAFRAQVEENTWPTIYEASQAAQADYARRHDVATAQATN